MEERILDKLDEMQKESMKLKLSIRDDIHEMDKRLIVIESRWKLIIPAVGIFFGVVGSYIKTHIFGIKG